MKASELKPGQVGKWAEMLIGKTDDDKYVVEFNGEQKVTSTLPIDVEVEIVKDVKIIKVL